VAEKVTIEYQGIKLAISYNARLGGPSSLLLIHGLGSSKECFDDIWNYPDYRQYTVIIPDLPGYGESNKPKNFSYSMEDQAEILELLVYRLNLKDLCVIGHSMGGAIGLLLALNIGPLARSLINLEGNLIRQDCSGSRAALKYTIGDFINHGFDELKESIALQADQSFLKSLNNSDVYAFYKSSKSLVKWSDSGMLLDMFLGLDIPKYYVYGEQNSKSPVLKYLDEIPKLMIPGAGHGMMNDNPSVFYSDLLRWL